jgi:hypothetical protein
MGPPPLSIGPNQVNVAERNPGVADISVGGCGLVRGITDAEGAEVDDRPTEFLTVTVNVYGVPFDKSVINCASAPG